MEKPKKQPVTEEFSEFVSFWLPHAMEALEMHLSAAKKAGVGRSDAIEAYSNHSIVVQSMHRPSDTEDEFLLKLILSNSLVLMALHATPGSNLDRPTVALAVLDALIVKMKLERAPSRPVTSNPRVTLTLHQEDSPPTKIQCLLSEVPGIVAQQRPYSWVIGQAEDS